jgi:hypothetical protein
MLEQEELYHSPQESGFWTSRRVFKRDISLRDGLVKEGVVPIGIKEQEGSLVMVLATFEGDITEPIDNFPGLRVVEGDSVKHPFETDGELLIEFDYLKIDQMEPRPRRIRPTGVKFGIWGDTEEASAEKGVHRAMGEKADYYLEGQDTQYDPGESGNEGLRFFPFWRIAVWGNPLEMAKEYLPEPPSQEEYI